MKVQDNEILVLGRFSLSSLTLGQSGGSPRVDSIAGGFQQIGLRMALLPDKAAS